MIVLLRLRWPGLLRWSSFNPVKIVQRSVRCLLELESTYREVLVLRFYEELSLEEIATRDQGTPSTVKSRLYRGLAALKPRMEQLRASRPFAEGAV